MPRKPKIAAPAADGLPEIPKEFLDQVITGPMTQEGIDEAEAGNAFLHVGDGLLIPFPGIVS